MFSYDAQLGKNYPVTHAISEIKGCNKAAPRILKVMAAEQNVTRRSVLCGIVQQIADDTIAPQLTVMLKQAKPCEPKKAGVHISLLRLLAKFPDPGAIPFIKRCLFCKNQNCRCSAALALSRSRDFSGVEVLLEDLKKQNNQLNSYTGMVISDTLIRMKAPNLSKIMQRAIQSATKKDKKAIIRRILDYQHNPKFMDLLVSWLDRKDKNVSKDAYSRILYIMGDHYRAPKWNYYRDITADMITPLQSLINNPPRMVIFDVLPGWQFVLLNTESGEFEFLERKTIREAFFFEKHGLNSEDCLSLTISCLKRDDYLLLAIIRNNEHERHLFRKTKKK